MLLPNSCKLHLHRFSINPNLYFRSSFTRWISNSISNKDLLDFFNHKLQQCTTIDQTKQTHNQILITGLHRFAFLAARLVSVYAGFGTLSNSFKVFETASIEAVSNILLWNSILRANLSAGCYGKVIKLYFEMRKQGLFGDGFSFPLIIKACGLMVFSDENLCRIVHNHVLRMGFRFHVHCGNELMGMYGKIGKMGDAVKVFDSMCVKNQISWNTMISGFAYNYDSIGAFEMFKRMQHEGFEPNIVTWISLLSSYTRCGRHEETIELFGVMRMRGIMANAEVVAVVLSACADSSALDKGQLIHCYVIKGGFDDYLIVKNSLISVYGKTRDLKHARILFLDIKEKNIVSWNSLISCYAESGFCEEAFDIFSQLEKSDKRMTSVRPNVVSWSAVISAFAANRRSEESLHLFRKMKHANVMANSVTICSALSACAELSALALGREIHAYLVRFFIDSNILAANGLINMYTKCGSIREGSTVFEKIIDKDIFSWNTIITGYGMNGFGEMALKLFNQMIETSIKPDEVTFVAVLSACSHAGLVSEGRQIFHQMPRKFSIQPQMEHFACMVDLLGRAGFLPEASDIVKNMPMKPNECVWGALLNSCRIHKNTDIADVMALSGLSLKPETCGSHMLLSNIYAASGRFQDSATVRTMAKMNGLKKNPGQSWIEINKKVYIFSAGKAAQMGLDDIYKVIQILVRGMDIECLIPDMTCVLHDVDV